MARPGATIGHPGCIRRAAAYNRTETRPPEEKESTMDDVRFVKDLPAAPEQSSVPTRRFAALAAAQDATYPMLAPAAAVHMGAEDAFDEEILAGLVNV
jgi:hypothetical protein